ncbi:MAG: (E)-4-hydroxy-3-methylbut-2-enyl-diphosphate synthase [Bacteroidales bacterium]|nr:(E)-4-hydroxy-3-methylbut-2-enyl-diphosphate synthase [Bacteroidales bacterium]
MNKFDEINKRLSPYRRLSWEVMVGNIGIGGRNPVRIQSMTNTDTMDIIATCDQVERLVGEGCELVRITAPDVLAAQNLRNIKIELEKRNCFVPLIADIHFNPKAAEVAAAIVEKIRINPGNYTDRNRGKISYSETEYNAELDKIKERLAPLIEICKKHNTAIRIGTNHGSLSERVVSRYGNTPLAMAISALEFAKICHSLGFDNLILSEKSSNVKTMVSSTRILCELLDNEGLNYPIHIGVTEAGDGQDGRIKSAVGIGALLAIGIGDTIRVSLTEKPEAEILVAKDILQASGDKIYKAEFVSCPSCGRTKYDIEAALAKVKQECSHLVGIKIGVMGCIVNGPGEMADAHYGYVGSGNKKVNLYRSKDLVYSNIDEDKAIEMLKEMIRQDGNWKDKLDIIK